MKIGGVDSTDYRNIIDPTFQDLYEVIEQHQLLLASIAAKLNAIENLGGGGGGSASIEDYESNQDYKRNMLLVDTETETVYRVIPESYTSITVETDCANGNLKLVGFESQIVAFDHEPTQAEINVIPDDSFVTIYNPTDTPYSPMS